jgi:hypothetical protein
MTVIRCHESPDIIKTQSITLSNEYKYQKGSDDKEMVWLTKNEVPITLLT